ncbi:MAG: hypothetical protein HY840_12740 [Bacteroidetes bacterium]|nr:hypothetical protein [Bacteroidota bacterium]
MNNEKEKNEIDERILEFLSAHTNLTLAVSDNDHPYCANCFYAYAKKKNLLIFKSSPETNHIVIALRNDKVAGIIIPDKLDKTRIQGIQFTGKISKAKGDDLATAKNSYYKKYPFAIAFSGELWVIELNFIKFTDNKLGFGKKLEWKKITEE